MWSGGGALGVGLNPPLRGGGEVKETPIYEARPSSQTAHHSGSSSVVECCLAKAKAEGSTPFFRFPLTKNFRVSYSTLVCNTALYFNPPPMLRLTAVKTLIKFIFTSLSMSWGLLGGGLPPKGLGLAVAKPHGGAAPPDLWRWVPYHFTATLRGV